MQDLIAPIGRRLHLRPIPVRHHGRDLAAQHLLVEGESVAAATVEVKIRLQLHGHSPSLRLRGLTRYCPLEAVAAMGGKRTSAFLRPIVTPWNSISSTQSDCTGSSHSKLKEPGSLLSLMH